MFILILCAYISITPIVLVCCKLLGFDDEFKEVKDYIDCN